MTLEQFFSENNKVAMGFSGGVDSSYLFYAGRKYGADLRAYFVKSAFQPQFEMDDAARLAEEIGAEITVLEMDVLGAEDVVRNPEDRCYYCKNRVFGLICAQAEQDGYSVIIDGTNASDDIEDRPGFRALKEMEIRSPLRECGLTKDDVRRLSREAGLFTWNKPSYACLATRIPTGERITEEKLRRVECAEDVLRTMGFSDFRVRMRGNTGLIQMPACQMISAVRLAEEIRLGIAPYFSEVVLDLKGRNHE